MILALDCSFRHALLSLELSPGRRLERISTRPREHAGWIGRMLAELGEEARRPWSDLERVALTLGPGSFTGLRVGLAVAKGLVFGTEIPLLPLPSLALPALAHAEAAQRSILVCRTARGTELWAACYAAGNREAAWERLLSLPELSEAFTRLRESEPKALLLGSLPARAAPEALVAAVIPEPAPREQIEILARLAREGRRLVSGPVRDAVLPRYLLEPAVTRPRRDSGSGEPS